MSHQIHCPSCDTPNEIPGNTRSGAIIEMACWACDESFDVNRYKMKIQ